ncbi:MAG: hypothetical protein WAM42_06835 [Candidatus Nitrosopolaris sp.]
MTSVNHKTMTVLAIAGVLVVSYCDYTKQTHIVAYDTKVSHFINTSAL